MPCTRPDGALSDSGVTARRSLCRIARRAQGTDSTSSRRGAGARGLRWRRRDDHVEHVDHDGGGDRRDRRRRHAVGAAYDITAEEYLAASIPDQIQAMKEFVEDNPDECAGEDAEGGGNFPQNVGINAAQAAPDTPMSEIILGECGGG